MGVTPAHPERSHALTVTARGRTRMLGNAVTIKADSAGEAVSTGKLAIYSRIRVTPAIHSALPVGGTVILQELPPHMTAGVHAGNDGIENPGSPIHDIQRRMEPVLCDFAGSNFRGILIRHP